MRFQVLGALEISHGGRWVGIRAAQQRIVLALLLAEAPRVVTVDRMVDEIWAERPPRAAVATVRGYVMRLRQLVGHDGNGPLQTRGRGYAIRLADGDLDAAEFERLVGAGRRALADGRLPDAVDRLRAGLALWRGPALADVPPTPTVAAEAARLERIRLTALELRLDADLRLGRHAEVVDELVALVGTYPLHERLWEQLMRALYRCGRRAEALDAYQRGRGRLVEEVGLEPGQSMRRLQQQILADDPALAGSDIPARPTTPAPDGPPEPVRVPAQLPADVAGFTNRADELRALDALLSSAPDLDHALVVGALTGPGGVGKTATAVHWAHRVRDRFPDGQLYVDLRGYSAGPPLRPGDALARFLRGLGVAATDVPADEDEAAALYRSLLAGRRMLIVLDNAREADQVRPLLPGGPPSLVLVTSRDQLGGLVAHEGAEHLRVDVLAPPHAEELVLRVLAGRHAGDRAAVATLARLCGYLPLALRIGAANVITSSQETVSDLVARMAKGDRLAELQVSGDRRAGVRLCFHHSYAALPDAERAMFRLLGVVSGPHVTVEAAAALADVAPERAAVLLRRLGRVFLVDERIPGRFTLHDLVREFAAERVAAEENGPARQAALGRLYDYYLYSAAVCADLLHPQFLRVPLPPAPDPPAARLAGSIRTAADASAWLDAERPNLVAAVRVGASVEAVTATAWRLADVLRGSLHAGLHLLEWQQVAEAALTAALADDDPLAEAAARLSLAQLDWVRGRHQDAIGHHTRALALAEQVGWLDGVCANLGNLGNLNWALGRLGAAAGYYRRALAISRRAGRPAVEATALSNLGLVHFELGRLDLAAEHHGQALDRQGRQGSGTAKARTMLRIGEVCQRLGWLDEATTVLHRALDLERATGDRIVEGDALRTLAAVHRDAGRYAEAVATADRALALATQTGDQRLQAGALSTRASAQARLALPAEAVDGQVRAVRLAGALGARYLETEALVGLAEAYRCAGRLAEAADAGVRGLEMARGDGYRLLAGDALAVLSQICQDRGDPAGALRHSQEAAQISAELAQRADAARGIVERTLALV